MKKLTLTWKKIVSLILGFFGIGTLVSCYGSPIPDGFLYGYVFGDIDGDGKINNETEGLPDVNVSVYKPEYENDKSNENLIGNVSTDDKGYFEVACDSIYENAELYFVLSDSDEEQNGSFKTKITKTNRRVFELERDDSQ